MTSATDTQTAYSPDVCVTWHEQNMYHDSYFHAVWWNGETFISREVGSTAHAGGVIPNANADENLKSEYSAWRNGILDEIRNARKEELLRAIVKGAYVTVMMPVTRGKNKIAAGEAGIVFWAEYVNNDPYGRAWGRKLRAGILVTDENGVEKKIYIDAERIRVQGFEDEYLPLENDVTEFGFVTTYPPAR